MTSVRTATRKNDWVNIIFFTVTTVAGVIGAPIYIYHYGISAPEIALFLFYFVATGLGITAGYHRLFAHATFRANGLIRFLLLFFGAAAFEQSALRWSAQHRDHHRSGFSNLNHAPTSRSREENIPEFENPATVSHIGANPLP